MGTKYATTTATQKLPGYLNSAYQNIVGQAQQTAQTPYEAYTGGFTPDQQTAFQNIGGLAGASNPAFAGASGALGQSMMPTWANTGNYMSPYTSQVIQAMMGNMQEQNAQQQQQVVGNAIAKGAMGGNRVGVAQSELARQQKLADNQALAGLYNQNWQQALGAAQADKSALLGAAGQSSGLGAQQMETGLAQAGAQLGAGTQQQQFDYQQYLNRLAFPYQQQGWMAGIAGGLAPSAGGTTTQQNPQGNILSQILGAVIGGASMMADGGVVPRRRGYAMGGSPYANDNVGAPGFGSYVGAGGSMPYGNSIGTFGGYVPIAPQISGGAGFPSIAQYEAPEDPLAALGGEATKQGVSNIKGWFAPTVQEASSPWGTRYAHGGVVPMRRYAGGGYVPPPPQFGGGGSGQFPKITPPPPKKEDDGGGDLGKVMQIAKMFMMPGAANGGVVVPFRRRGYQAGGSPVRPPLTDEDLLQFLATQPPGTATPEGTMTVSPGVVTQLDPIYGVHTGTIPSASPNVVRPVQDPGISQGSLLPPLPTPTNPAGVVRDITAPAPAVAVGTDRLTPSPPAPIAGDPAMEAAARGIVAPAVAAATTEPAAGVYAGDTVLGPRDTAAPAAGLAAATLPGTTYGGDETTMPLGTGEYGAFAKGVVPFREGEQFVTQPTPGYSQNIGDAWNSFIAGEGLNLSPDVRQAMLGAGLGMMSSRSPFALAGIGEGGLKGIDIWNKRQDALRADAEARARNALLGAQTGLTGAQTLQAEVLGLSDQWAVERTPVGLWIRYKPSGMPGTFYAWGDVLPNGNTVRQEDFPAAPGEGGLFTTTPPFVGYDPLLAAGGETAVLVTEESNAARVRAQNLATAATDTQFLLQEMRHSLDQLPEHGIMTPGTAFPERAALAKSINTYFTAFGLGTPFPPAEVAAGEDLNKVTTRLGFELSQMLGSNEAASVIQNSINAVPSGANSKEGAQLLINALEAGNRRRLDYYTALQKWRAAHSGSVTGFETWFNSTNPPELYALSAYVPPEELVFLRQHPEAASDFNEFWGYGRDVARFVLSRGR